MFGFFLFKSVTSCLNFSNYLFMQFLQVIDASFGDVEIQQDLDINFNLFSPHGKELVIDFKKSDAVHR